MVRLWSNGSIESTVKGPTLRFCVAYGWYGGVYVPGLARPVRSLTARPIAPYRLCLFLLLFFASRRRFLCNDIGRFSFLAPRSGAEAH